MGQGQGFYTYCYNVGDILCIERSLVIKTNEFGLELICKYFEEPKSQPMAVHFVSSGKDSILLSYDL